MPIDLAGPDLVVSLILDPFAPRAAHYVAQVDHPSPDLRDAVMLLTGELVTRAAQQCQARFAGGRRAARVDARRCRPSGAADVA